MNFLLVLGFFIAAAHAQTNTLTKDVADEKFLTLPGIGALPAIPGLPVLDAAQSNLVLGGALGVGATLLGQQVLGNKPCPPGFGRRKRQAEGEEADEKIFGLFGNNNNCVPQNTNPCKRKKRQSEGVDTGEKVDPKFFGLLNGLLGGGSQNNPCAPTNAGQPQGFQQGYNQGYASGYQNGANFNSNNVPDSRPQGVCQCSNYSKIGDNGNEEAKCARADHTGRRWCYSTSSSRCADAQRSNKYPNNPWSYEACNN